jgi:hypothetical protein
MPRLPREELRRLSRIVLLLPREETTMRWKISRHGHDPRQVDLLAAIALVIIIVSACSYFGSSPKPPDRAAFIVPSQSVRW